MSITDSPVVELRQYTLKPGARDTLVEIFEAEFVESQDRSSASRSSAVFEDRDDPDRFVWMRGRSMRRATRRRSPRRPTCAPAAIGPATATSPLPGRAVLAAAA